MRRMVKVRNSTMSPEFRLNSPFHSVPVKGDYKLSKKNEILVDLFLNTLFHAVPPQSPLPPFPSFLPTKFARFFHFFSLQPLCPPVPSEWRSGQRPPGSTTLPSVSNLATKASNVGDLSFGAKLPPSPPPLSPLCEENPCRDASMGGCELSVL